MFKIMPINCFRLFINHSEADIFLSLINNSILPEFASLQKPVLINSVIQPLSELNAPANVCRINGWPGFLNRSSWEIAGHVNEALEAAFAKFEIAMIINEAFFTVDDGVSSKDEIDIAMKLGTNYPYGPFEWADIIGAGNIQQLLQKLNETDSRYKPSALLIKETNGNS
jgi:3-hydroxybutyryl-CoA dehydrogenase